MQNLCRVSLTQEQKNMTRDSTNERCGSDAKVIQLIDPAEPIYLRPLRRKRRFVHVEHRMTATVYSGWAVADMSRVWVPKLGRAV
jgi:hypothetical protein